MQFVTSDTAELHVKHIVAELQQALRARNKGVVVIGLSGGVDSAVAAAIAVRALGPENIHAVSMPYARHAGGRYSPSSLAAENDAVCLARYLDIPVNIVDIASAVDALAANLGLGLNSRVLAPQEQITLGNTKARIRAVILRGTANLDSNALVLGTENRTEHYLGYFTIGGDEESDIEILHSYYKTEIWALARYLGLPEAIVNKAPSADLWDGQTDENELGITYRDADIVLARTIDGRIPQASDLIDKAIEEKVMARVRATKFKRTDKPCGTRPEGL